MRASIVVLYLFVNTYLANSQSTTKIDCNKANEYFACGSYCETTCATLGEQCPVYAYKCVERCYCIEGYARDSNGECIPIADCPPKPVCDDPNAAPAPCGDPCPLTCSERDHPHPRLCSQICIINGCKCKPGYIKDQYGMCILPKNCFIGVCGINEEYNTCMPNCPEKSCESIFSGLQVKCGLPASNDLCKGGCLCKPGYVRNKNNICILPQKCCPRNSEIVRCPNLCPGGTCAQKEFTPCFIGCPYKGCQCKKGYVKWSDTNRKCVSIRACPREDDWY